MISLKRNFGWIAILFVGMLLFFGGIKAHAATAGDIAKFEKTDDKTFTISSGSDQFKVIFNRSDMVRIWLGVGGNFQGPSGRSSATPKEPIVIKDDFGPVTVSWSDEGSYYKMATDKFVLRAYKSPLKFAMFKSDNATVVWQEDAPLTYSSSSTTQKLVRGADEYYYGGGMQNGFFSHRDRKIVIAKNYGDWSSGTVSNPSPFYLSTAGYGVLRNTFQDGTYDFGSPAQLTHNENRFDAYYFYGESIKDILNGYTDLTGKPALIPRWGMGLGDSDCYNTSNTSNPKPGKLTTPDVLKVAQGYRDHDMPGAWVLPNDGYGCGYVQLGSTVQQLHQLGFYTGLWTQNGVSQMAQEVGVDGTRLAKLDVAWVGPGYDFALDGTRQAYTGIENNSNDRGYVWSVGGWAGTQRYSTVWSGDQSGSWEYIRYHIPTLIGAGLSGIPYATGDIDGIFGGSAQTYVRDLQWKAFTPILMNMSGWAAKDKQPWVWGEPYTSYNRDYLKLRERLTPYFYTYLNEAYESGAPLVRGMLYEFPNDPNTKNTLTQYQFMSGQSFLVAPVYKDAAVRNGIYLPKGKWIDYWTGAEHYGSKMLDEYAAPLNRLPLLVKAGAIIPMYPDVLYDGQTPPNPITYDIYPYGTSSFTMYEDDGVSKEHRTGKFAKTIITSIAPQTGTDDLKIQVGASVGDYNGKLSARVNQFQIHMHLKPAGVSVGGTAYAEYASKAEWTSAASGWYFDAADKGGIVYVKTPEMSTSQGFELKLAGFEADTTPLIDATVIPLPEPDNDPTRIAQGDIAVTATSADATAPAANVLDGSNETVWSTKLDGSNPLPQSITLNLGTKFSVNKLKYLPIQYLSTNGIITAYNVYASTDGTNYTKVASGTWNADKSEKTVTFATVEAQYVRLEATAGVGGFAAAAELNVYRDGSVPIPLPIPKTQMTASAKSFQSGNEPAKAIDGDSNSMWHTKWDGSDKLPQSITLDLGKVREISQFRYAPRLDAGNGTITAYNLYVSADGTNYSKISSGSWVRNNQKKYVQFAAVKARYVKLEATAAVGGFVSASELDVYEAPTAPPVLGVISDGKPANADSEDPAFPAANANDGKPETMWSAKDANPGHTWTVDLGKMYSIQGLEISFEHPDKAYQYKLEIREPGSSNWIQVVDRTTNAEIGQVLKNEFGSQGRYARITITGLPDAGTKAAIMEVKLIGLPIIGTAPVTGVTLNPSSLNLNILGAPVTLEATVSPSNAANPSVRWSSSDPGVAMVDENGVVTPKGQGNAVVTVTTEDGGFKATADVSVTGQQNLIKIPQSQMSATAASFQAGNEPGLALDGDPNTWWHIKWFNVDPLPQSIVLNLGGTYKISKLEYLPRPDAGNGTISAYNVYVSNDGVQFTKVASGAWLTNNSLKEVNFAPIDAAYIKLEATAGVGNFASASELNVYKIQETIPVTGIQLDTTAVVLKGEETAQIHATVLPLNATNKKVSWSSSAPEVAIVDNNGVVKAVGEGKAILTVTTQEGGFHASVSVIVDRTPPVTTDDAKPEWQRTGQTIHLTPTDAGSGVADTFYSVNGGEFAKGLTIVINDEGIHTIKYYSEDLAGNVEQMKSTQLKIDKTAPVIQTTAVTPSTVTVSVYHTDAVSVPIVITDALSGVADAKVTLDGAVVNQNVTADPLSLALGVHDIGVTATDNAGNISVQHYVLNVMMDIGHLDEEVQLAFDKGWITNSGILNSLMAKIDNIQKQQGDAKQTLNGLNALENEIRAQSGKKIDAAFANIILADIAYMNNQH
ncbi:discoidin domain-containing protein [Paenibacillus sp. GCM10027628]|uniref:discoidin domain-containing protein n=1 Tax=Paenibacillus sp. GCM10027628 TaxID=3273413 RepID=UPI0036262E3E